jgi:hypothetical protein
MMLKKSGKNKIFNDIVPKNLHEIKETIEYLEKVGKFIVVPDNLCVFRTYSKNNHNGLLYIMKSQEELRFFICSCCQFV